MHVKVLEPASHRKRSTILELRRQKRTGFDTGGTTSRLRQARWDAMGKMDHLMHVLLRLNGFDGSFLLRTEEEAAEVITREAGGIKDILSDNSLTAESISKILRKKGLNVINTYSARYDPAKVARPGIPPKLCWERLWNSFEVRTLKVATKGNLSPYVALLGLASISTDGTIFLLQHFTNISEMVTKAKVVFFLAGPEKVVETPEDAELQARLMALFGYEALLFRAGGMRLEADVPEFVSEKGIQKAYLLLLDWPTKQMLGSPFMELLLCIGCRRCNILCPSFIEAGPLVPRRFLFYLRSALFPEQEEIWACTLCRACATACPMEIDLTAAIIELRKELMAARTSIPGRLRDLLRNMRQKGNPFGL